MNDIILELNNTIDQFLKTDIQSISWNGKLSEDKWSKKEIIGHLIDSAQINLQRFVRCTYEENFKLIYEQVNWVEAQRYQEADINELLILWRSLNMQIIRVLQNYPPNRLHTKCDNSKTAVSLHTVEWLAQDYVDHLKHHLKQVY
jgi:DinB superfamily